MPRIDHQNLKFDDGSEGVMYFAYGQPANHLALKDKASEMAGKLQLVSKELEFCEYSIQNYIKLFTDIHTGLGPTLYIPSAGAQFVPSSLDQPHLSALLQATFVAAVVTYAKCFVGNKGRPNLDRGEIFKGDGSRFLKLHEWYVGELRHNFLAHGSSDGKFDFALTVLVVPQYGGATFFPEMTVHAKFLVGLPLEDIEDLLEMVKFVRGIVREKVRAAMKHAGDTAKSRYLADKSNVREVNVTKYNSFARPPRLQR